MKSKLKKRITRWTFVEISSKGIEDFVSSVFHELYMSLGVVIAKVHAVNNKPVVFNGYGVASNEVIPQVVYAAMP